MILETLPNGADYIDVARDPSFGRPDARQGLQQDLSSCHRAFVFSHEGRYSSRVKYLLRFILLA